MLKFHGKLVGILTQSDVVRLVLKDTASHIATGTNLAMTTVGMVMTQLVQTILRSQCSSISSVWSYLQQHSIDHLPILNDKGELVGVINFRRISQSFLPVESKSEKNIEDNLDPQGNLKLAISTDIGASKFDCLIRVQKRFLATLPLKF